MDGIASTTMWMRLNRRLGLDHNPLRRRCDRIAGWLLPAMLAALLVIGPLAALLAGRWAQARNDVAWQAQRSWHHVPAVLLASTPGPMFPAGGANSWTVWTSARWTADGQTHVGKVPAMSDSKAGTVVTVWLDPAGTPRMPLTPTAASNRVVTAAAMAVAALAVLLAVLTVIVRWVLDRRRLASWEAAWLSVGPQWSRHP
jgi:hypothetical protein